MEIRNRCDIDLVFDMLNDDDKKILAMYYLEYAAFGQYLIKDDTFRGFVYDAYHAYIGHHLMSEKYFSPLDENDKYFGVFITESSGERLYLGKAKIILGDHGPYYEFSSLSKEAENRLIIPARQQWRLQEKYKNCKYLHKEIGGLKIYHQRGTVEYAPYKVGHYYLSLYYADNIVFYSGV